MWNWIKDKLSTLIGKINWFTSHTLEKPREFNIVREKLKDNYYIILTRHDGHLSTFFIALSHFVLTGTWGYYAHVLMNMEDGVNADSDYRFIEATGKGVHYSDFNEVFDPQCSSVALLKPKGLTLADWTECLDKAKTEIGKPYDTLFDLANDQELSCVEVVRVALQSLPDYDIHFAEFEKMINRAHNLDPHMFYECPDFEVVWEKRH